ncbi:hypothetical protein ACFWVP_30775 [Streptomyces sp. NPDC058637]|uniref:hypothetical protein n=1 Tax=Streptomyces sp. NPDC058637 TaxID=3346569 RepID=UPI00365BC755
MTVRHLRAALLLAAAVALKAGHLKLHTDRHRIEITARPRPDCPRCHGEGDCWTSGAFPEMEACGCWSDRRELRAAPAHPGLGRAVVLSATAPGRRPAGGEGTTGRPQHRQEAGRPAPHPESEMRNTPSMTDRLRAIEGLALVAALTAVFDGVHALGDHFVQSSHDASTKGMHGSHMVYKNDGSPVEESPWRYGKEGRTCTASACGRRPVCRHVASYSAVQLAVTRTLGYRVPVSALLTGAAINAITHGILDRREPLLWNPGELHRMRDPYRPHAAALRKSSVLVLSDTLMRPKP